MKKNFKLVLALVLALSLFASMSAMAATITINRDSTWKASSEEDRKATYTPYKIFDADLDDADHPVYTISGTNADAKVAALPAIFTAKKAADGKYYITLTDSATTAATIVAALETLVKDNATLFPAGTAVTSAEDPVTLEVTDDGYYLVTASNGKNAAVQTIGSAVINEKNDYPTIDKKQKKAAGATYGNDKIEAEIGKVIDYEITVTIPADAVGPIAVIDKMSAGLTYNSNFATDPAAAGTASRDLTASDTKWGYVATAPDGYTIPFQKLFSAEYVEAHRGETIVITYTATVNSSALVPTGRENEAKLVYDEGNYVLHDTVEYTTYFGGIEKVDGANTTIKLEGVKFTLTENKAAYNVEPVYDTDGSTVLYYIPGGSSNEVVTGANGKIIIRGLDNTKTYTLTETETNKGYNLIETPKNLTLEEDTGNYATKDNYDQVVNNKGATLPSTGGIGTTIFYIAGSVLVLAAAILLITKRRMSNND